MIDHIVLLKLKKGSSQNQIDIIFKSILRLKDEIPGIISISYGQDNSPQIRNHGFTHGFVIRFKDSQARDNYLPHPKHQSVAKESVSPNVEDILVFDYDV